MPIINGTSGNDVLDGSGEADLINGLEGDDTIEAGSGDDEVHGGDGTDFLGGQDGNDRLFGDADNDMLIGFNGDDHLDGGAGADEMDGGAGADTYVVDDADDMVSEAGDTDIDTIFASVSYALFQWDAPWIWLNVENLTLTGSADIDGWGTGDANVITGNSGNNELYSGGGDDWLVGNEGNDRLDGGAGLDRLYGGFGDDSYIVADDTDYTYESDGEGVDTVFASLTHRLRDNLENLTLTGTGNFYGTGNALANVVTGNAGRNRLYGLDGDDRLYGEDGNDQLEGGAGLDRMYGGLGNDVYVVSDTTDYAYEYQGEGTDKVYASISHGLRDNIERLELTGTANIYGKGNGLANIIDGNAGRNRLYGLDGDDRLYGRDGNDRMDGGAGVDRMYGGLGNDVYVANDATDYAYEAAGEGVDAVYASVDQVLRANIERLYLTGDSAINGYGNELANVLVGNSAGNLIRGRAGNDVIHGEGGDDIVDGEDGNDWLEGGSGSDRFYGGSGSDRFVFRDGDMGADAASADIVHDFSQAENDHIHLGAVDADTTADGRQDFAFIADAAFTGTAGELRFEQIDGDTYVQGDTDGDGVADFMIRLQGLHNLTSDDFLF